MLRKKCYICGKKATTFDKYEVPRCEAHKPPEEDVNESERITQPCPIYATD